MAGLISFPFKFNGVTNAANVDSATTTGYYAIRDAANKINGWTAFGTMLVYNTFTNLFVLQLFFHTEGEGCFRTKNDKTWGAWRTFSLS